MDSILQSIKKLLGLTPEYDAFDPDIVMCINSSLMNCTQIGIGPEEGYFITGPKETWKDFLGTRKDIETVKTFIYMKTRLMFDPPSSSFVLQSMNEQVKEMEWRLYAHQDNKNGGD